MTNGDRLVQIHNAVGGYQIKLPAPPTLTNALNHLSQLEPHVRANLVVVTLVAESIVPAEEALRLAEQDKRDTIPAPESVLTESEFLEAIGSDVGGVGCG